MVEARIMLGPGPVDLLQHRLGTDGESAKRVPPLERWTEREPHGSPGTHLASVNLRYSHVDTITVILMIEVC